MGPRTGQALTEVVLVAGFWALVLQGLLVSWPHLEVRAGAWALRLQECLTNHFVLLELMPR